MNSEEVLERAGIWYLPRVCGGKKWKLGNWDIGECSPIPHEHTDKYGKWSFSVLFIGKMTPPLRVCAMCEPRTCRCRIVDSQREVHMQ
jgi:hypothetical protein